MSTKDLIKSKMPEYLRPFFEKSFDLWHELKPDAGIIESIDSVERICNSLAEISRSKDNLVIEFSPDGLIRSAEEMKWLRPELENLRFEVFGKKSPPFSNLDKMTKEIKGIAKEQEAERAKKHPKEKFSYFQYSILPIVGKDILIYPKTPLALLTNKTKVFSERTCFSQASLITFILIGIEPIARIYKVSQGKFLDLRIYRPLTEREFMSLFKRIRQGMRPPRKRLTSKHLKLYEFFEKYGPPPAKGKIQFWEKAFREWKKLYPRDEINSWRALMMAWRRLNELIQRRG